MEPKGSLPHSQVPVTYSYPDKRVPFTTAWRVLRLRMEERYPIWRVAANILISLGQPTRGGPPVWGLGEVLTTRHRKNLSWYEPFTKKASDLD